MDMEFLLLNTTFILRLYGGNYSITMNMLKKIKTTLSCILSKGEF